MIKYFHHQTRRKGNGKKNRSSRGNRSCGSGNRDKEDKKEADRLMEYYKSERK